MIVNVISILNQYGTTTVAKIKENLAASGTNATGRTSNSLRFEVKDEGFKQILTIYGRPFFMTVETGRKATPDYKPSQQFVASIQEWMNAKGVPGSAYAIARSIHKKGTKLFREGGRKDIVTDVVSDVSQISKSLLDAFTKEVTAHTLKMFSSGSTNN